MKRIFSFIITLIMTACALTGVGFVSAEGDNLTTFINENFNNYSVSETFSASSTGLSCSFVSTDSRIRGVNYPGVNGSVCIAANKLDMRYWGLSIKDKAYQMELSVKVDDNFDNVLAFSIVSSQPSMTGAASEGIVLFFVSAEGGEPALMNGQGQKIVSLPRDKKISIVVNTTRGSSDITIKMNGEKYEAKTTLAMYDIVGVNLSVTPGNTKPITDPYILIDNLTVSTTVRKYPQRYSLQEVGEFEDITVPEAVESDGYTVYANGTELAMQYAPEEHNGLLYVDLEQLAYCLGLSLTKDGDTYTLGDNLASFKIGDDKIAVTCCEMQITGAPMLLHGRPFVSLNFINEALNAKVWQDSANQMVVLTFGERKNDGILRKIGNMLYMDGEPYYEISFNKFDLFYQLIAEINGDWSYPTAEYQIDAARAALSQLRDLGFKTIRSFVYSSTYFDLMENEEHLATYLKYMDLFFDLCDEYGIKVVVCMGLVEDSLTYAEYVEGEGYIPGLETKEDAVAYPDSKSRQTIYKYIDTVVSRYKNRQSVLMWEIRNEAALECDIGFTVQKMKYSLGQLAEFYSSCAARIRANDSEHLISGGDAILRNAQWHLYKSGIEGTGNDWTVDTAEQRLKVIYLLNKDLDVISTHPYGLSISDESCILDENGYLTRLSYEYYMEEARRLGLPLYNGECNTGLGLNSSFYTQTENYLNSIIDSGVQLTHWWNFRSDRQGFNDGYLWTISDGQLLDMLVAANKTIKERWLINDASAANTNAAYEDASVVPFDISKLSSGKENVTTPANSALPVALGIGAGVAVIGGATFIIIKKKKNAK